MFEYVKVVSRLSNVIKWNKDSDVMESMLIPIKKGVNILTYVDFSKTCHSMSLELDDRGKVISSLPKACFKSGQHLITWQVLEKST